MWDWKIEIERCHVFGSETVWRVEMQFGKSDAAWSIHGCFLVALARCWWRSRARRKEMAAKRAGSKLRLVSRRP